MPVDSQHPEYTEKIARWQKNIDAYHGEDSVKARGETYLVSPGGFNDNDYKRYKQRAKWFGATARTINGLNGVVFQKDPVIEASDAVIDHLKDVTLTGISSYSFAKTVLHHVHLIGRYGVLVDYSDELRRPYWSGFPATCVINWRTALINNVIRPTMIVIKEVEFMSKDNDEFDVEETTFYRHAFLNSDGQYQIDRYQSTSIGPKQELNLVSQTVMLRRGQPLDFIPFQFFGSEDLTSDINRGPLDDLVDINYAYYRHSADYEHGLFLTGVPTPVVTGHALEPSETLAIGSLVAWNFSNPEAKAYLLEYQGHGLQTHERAMENDKKEAATLGARMLEEMPNTQETYGGVLLRHSGEFGTTKAITMLVSDGLTKLLQWHHWWNGDTENLEDDRYVFELNTDFHTAGLDPQTMTALFQIWQSGGMSQDAFLWNMKQGERIPHSVEDEKELIANQAPARLPFEESIDDDGGQPITTDA